MKEIHIEKSKIQAEALSQFILHGHRGIIAAATGSGKALIGINYIKHEETRLKKRLNILLVVPTTKLRDENWKTEFIEWANEELYNRIDRLCYASINKVRGRHYDIIILDELQNLTPLNSEFFDNNVVDAIMGLSATPPKELEKKEILNKLKLQVVYKLSLDDAVKRGVVSPFDIYLVEFNLDDKTKYIKAGNKLKPFMTTEQKQYEYLTKRINVAQAGNGNSWDSLKFMRLARMRFIYNLQSKKRIGKYMLGKIIPEDERTLIFAGSIKMAEELESKTYHSKSKDDDFNDFFNEKINRLSAVQALNEGMNIPNLDNALIVQTTSKERHLLQKIGRIIRHREGHRAKIYLMYAKGTVDEEWVLKATENISMNNVKHLKFKV